MRKSGITWPKSFERDVDYAGAQPTPLKLSEDAGSSSLQKIER